MRVLPPVFHSNNIYFVYCNCKMYILFTTSAVDLYIFFIYSDIWTILSARAYLLFTKRHFIISNLSSILHCHKIYFVYPDKCTFYHIKPAFDTPLPQNIFCLSRQLYHVDVSSFHQETRYQQIAAFTTALHLHCIFCLLRHLCHFVCHDFTFSLPRDVLP